MPRLCAFLLCCLLPSISLAAVVSSHDYTTHWVGFLALAIFVIAYVLVIFEETLHLRKSKPVLVAAGLIWILIALAYHEHDPEGLREAIEHNFLEYAKLFFFLLVAMTYINAMLERGVFDALRNSLVEHGFSYRALYWFSGLLAFLISPLADNLTTALIMCAVVMAVGKEQPKFVSLSCISIVVGANAGGAFSPFGDITTLMVWQAGIVDFFAFLKLFFPALVNFMIPAAIMSLALPKGVPPASSEKHEGIEYGGRVIVVLFVATIITAVTFHNVLHLPPVFGMLMGLGYLKIYAFYLRRHGSRALQSSVPTDRPEKPFDIFERVAHAEWDTLFFFYGVIMSVGGLGFIGYLELASAVMYGEVGATAANVMVGLMSAVVDNIPVMFAVLTMHPDMNETQWLLVTLTAGVGGSLLSIGSAAGVALMGQARGYYTFFTHLKWTPIIALGYAGSIYLHMLINGR